jgi:hypothetical protein
MSLVHSPRQSKTQWNNSDRTDGDKVSVGDKTLTSMGNELIFMA